MTTPRIDWDKPIETVGGKRARLLGKMVRPDGFVNVVAVDDGERESLWLFGDDGESAFDVAVRNVPEAEVERVVWLVRYIDGGYGAFENFPVWAKGPREIETRLRVPIKYRKGQFDEEPG